jgi:hypothetical protein
VRTHVLGDKTEIAHDLLGVADEMPLAQHVELGRNAGGAGIEVADAQELAAHRNHRRGAEAEAFRAEDGRLDDVQAGLEAAIRLQADALAQAVAAQCLVRFDEAQFPRRACMVDRAERARARAAVVAGHGDEIRIGLDHAGRDRAHARVRDQLHRHQRVGIDLLEVVDQLREILDRIDVVVRRRRDQSDARPRAAQSRSTH